MQKSILQAELGNLPFRPVPMSWSSIALIWSWADIVDILSFNYFLNSILSNLAEPPLYKALEKLIKNKMADTQDAKQRVNVKDQMSETKSTSSEIEN